MTEVLELELTVIRGDGLAAKDTNMFGTKKKSDPYVEVILCPYGPLQGEDKKILVGKTMPKMKTLSPRWDATFVTSFPSDEFTEFAAFELKIWDYDKRNDDDPMGTIHVKIPQFISAAESGTTTKWYRVMASSLEGDEATGRLECTLRTRKKTLPKGERPLAFQEPVIPLILQAVKKSSYIRIPRVLKKKKKLEEIAQAGPKEDMVELDITIARARDLAAMDTNILGMKAKSDPYIVVRLCPQGLVQGGNKIYMGKTPHMLKTLNPVWKEQNVFSITLPRQQFNRHCLFELAIWDYDKKNEDDIMGVVPVKFNFEKSGSLTKWYKVPAGSAGGAGASGEVECTVNVTTGGQDDTPTDYRDTSIDVEESLNKRMSNAVDRRRSVQIVNTGTKREEIIDLKLTVKRARGLTAMDNNIVGMSTTSDPYVIVKLCRLGPPTPDYMRIDVGKTHPEFKNLNPVWDKSFPMLSVPKEDLNEYALFELTIWDFDDLDDDDLMGKVSVHIPIAKSGYITKWYPVPASSAGAGLVAKGEVECTLAIRKRTVDETDEEYAGLMAQRPRYKEKPKRVVQFAEQQMEAVGAIAGEQLAGTVVGEQLEVAGAVVGEQLEAASAVVGGLVGALGGTVEKSLAGAKAATDADSSTAKNNQNTTNVPEIGGKQDSEDRQITHHDGVDAVSRHVAGDADTTNAPKVGENKGPDSQQGTHHAGGSSAHVANDADATFAPKIGGKEEADNHQGAHLDSASNANVASDADTTEAPQVGENQGSDNQEGENNGGIDYANAVVEVSWHVTPNADGYKDEEKEKSKANTPGPSRQPIARVNRMKTIRQSIKQADGHLPPRTQSESALRKRNKLPPRTQSESALRKRNKAARPPERASSKRPPPRGRSMSPKGEKTGTSARTPLKGRKGTKDRSSRSRGRSDSKQGSSSSLDIGPGEVSNPTKKVRSKRELKKGSSHSTISGEGGPKQGSSSSLDIGTDAEDNPTKKSRSKKGIKQGSSSSLDIGTDAEDNPTRKSRSKKGIKQGSSSSLDIGTDAEDNPTKKPRSKKVIKKASSHSTSGGKEGSKQGTSSSLETGTDEKGNPTNKPRPKSGIKKVSSHSTSRGKRDPKQGSNSSLDVTADKNGKSTKKSKSKRASRSSKEESSSSVDIDIDEEHTPTNKSKSAKQKNGKKKPDQGSSSSVAADIDIEIDEEGEGSSAKSAADNDIDENVDIDIDENVDIDIDEDDTPSKKHTLKGNRSAKRKSSAKKANTTNGKLSKDDDHTSATQSSGQEGSDPGDVYQQRMKVYNIYQQWNAMKKGQSEPKKPLVMFPGQGM